MAEDKKPLIISTAAQLARVAQELYKRGFKIKPEIKEKQEIRTLLSANLGLGFSSLSLSDAQYYVIDWQTWQEIIRYDWTDKMKYLKDIRDCDNFAFAFSARMSEIFGINTATVAFGDIYWMNAQGQRIKGRHAFNIIITKVGGVLKTIIYEPMNDGSCLTDKGKPFKINKWEYFPDWVIAF